MVSFELDFNKVTVVVGRLVRDKWEIDGVIDYIGFSGGDKKRVGSWYYFKVE